MESAINTIVEELVLGGICVYVPLAVIAGRLYRAVAEYFT